MFGDVVGRGAVGVVVSTAEELAEYRVIPVSERMDQLLQNREERRPKTHGFLTPFGLMCQPAR